MDDDLVQMVNAGLIPATVTTGQRADLWSKVLDHFQSHPELVIASGGQLAWVMRRNNPQFKQLVDEFVASHAVGTSFGNTLLRRYLQNTKWVTDSTSGEEMKKFQTNLALFQKYAGDYDFDYLMIAAQGYQESLLDQSKRNPSGAVGIMQVIPKNAAASPIDIPSVRTADTNIHAGVKMLRNIDDNYFNDPKIDHLNKTLFVFASYNAGPNRIARLRKEAAAMGLDPNVWFGNVELVAAKDIGQETVTYVGNIYKYYVAYKLAVEERGSGAGQRIIEELGFRGPLAYVGGSVSPGRATGSWNAGNHDAGIEPPPMFQRRDVDRCRLCHSLSFGGYFSNILLTAFWIFFAFFSGLSLNVSVPIPRKTSFSCFGSIRSTTRVPLLTVLLVVVEMEEAPHP